MEGVFFLCLFLIYYKQIVLLSRMSSLSSQTKLLLSSKRNEKCPTTSFGDRRQFADFFKTIFFQISLFSLLKEEAQMMMLW